MDIVILILFGYIMLTTYPSSTRGDIQIPGVGRLSRPSAGFFNSTARKALNMDMESSYYSFSLIFYTRLTAHCDVQEIGLKI